MDIQQIFRQRLQNQQSSIDELRPNQIIQGRILKLYPENKALIQMGGRQQVAQLDISLSVGERYFFQVQNETEYIHLKVLGDALKQSVSTNIDELLNLLDLSKDRSTRQLVQHFMRNQIPFNKRKIKQLVPILKMSKQPERSLSIMTRMINQQYPLTWDVFQSLKLLETTNFSKELQSFLQNLTELNEREHPQLKQMIRTINRLVTPSKTDQSSRALLETMKYNRPLFTLLQGFQLLDRDVISKIKHKESLSKLLSVHKPYRLPLPSINEMINKLAYRSSIIMEQAKTFLSIWEGPLEQAVSKQMSMSKDDFLNFKQQIKQYFSPILSKAHEHILSKYLKNGVEPLRSILAALRSLQNESIYQTIQDVQDNRFSPKIELIQQIQKILRTVGINYEQQILNDEISENKLTLKQSLLQLVKSQDLPINQDRVQRLLNFINGLQIQSVEHSSHLVYANLTIPAKILNLNKDLYMQFQSKKTADKTINPNHCRILFVLNLQRIDETIIDMNIQDRIISVKIYNDHNFLKSLVKPFEYTLRDRLKDMNYNLSSVTFKPLQEHKKDQPIVKSSNNKNFSGVDYRI